MSVEGGRMGGGGGIKTIMMASTINLESCLTLALCEGVTVAKNTQT